MDTATFQLIQNAKKILIIPSHPDFDSIGSAIILKRILKSQGKDVRAITYENLEKNFSCVPLMYEIEVEEPNFVDYSAYDLVITVDAPGVHLLTSPQYRFTFAFPKNLAVISIDHHLVTTPFTPYVVYDTNVSSTVELIYREFIKDGKYEISKEEAMVMFFGLVSDTGFFKWALGPQTFLFASFLFEKKVDVSYVTSYVESHRPIQFHKFLTYYLPHVEFFEYINFMLLTITLKDRIPLESLGISYTDMKPLRDIYQYLITRTYEGYPLGGLLIENPDGSISGDFRGDGYQNKTDIAKLCKEMSETGGGHFNAGGFILKGKTLSEVKEMLLGKIREEKAKDGI